MPNESSLFRTIGAHALAPLMLAVALTGCGGGGGSGGEEAQSTGDGPVPTVSMSANPTNVASGQSSTLTWTSANATSCTASGAWSGSKPTSGSAQTAALTQTKDFTLSCNGPGGGAVARVTVTVGGSTSPSVQISASPPGVSANGNTTLTWSSANVTSCTASGAWSGSKSVSGSQQVGPINQDLTYQLSCSGQAGNAIAMVTVGVRQAALSWSAPTQNVDGSALTSLAGYKVYWGTSSRSYPNNVDVAGASNTAHTLALNPGTYFFAVTALDSSGNESTFSGEVSKTVL